MKIVMPWNVWLAVAIVFAVLLLLPVWLFTGPRRHRHRGDQGRRP